MGNYVTATPGELRDRGHFGCVLPTPFPATVDDVSDAIIYLASDLSRAVRATQLTVDRGAAQV